MISYTPPISFSFSFNAFWLNSSYYSTELHQIHSVTCRHPSNKVEDKSDEKARFSTLRHNRDGITTPSCIIESQTDDLGINQCSGRRNEILFYRPPEHLLRGKQERLGNYGRNIPPAKSNNPSIRRHLAGCVHEVACGDAWRVLHLKLKCCLSHIAYQFAHQTQQRI